MASKGNSGSRVPARDGGNRKDPVQKLGLGGALPPNYNNTYGVGDGKGGGADPAKDGGNRKDPKQKLGLGGGVPPKYDAFMPPIKK